MAFILILNGPLRATTVSVDGPRFVLGRREGCHLAIPDGRVSREHAVLVEVAPGSYRVQDLESENGVFVNGSPCSEQDLRHDDVLRVGRTELRFLEFEVEEAAPSGVAETPAEQNGEHARTEGERSPDPKDPRTDHRERLRRLERQLLEKESDNARLAAENARLNRDLLVARKELEEAYQRIEPQVEVVMPRLGGGIASWPAPAGEGVLDLVVRAADAAGRPFEQAGAAAGRSTGGTRPVLELKACGPDSLPALTAELQELTRSDRRTRGLLLGLGDGVQVSALKALGGRLGGPSILIDLPRLATLARKGWQEATPEARALHLLGALAEVEDPAFRELLTRSGVHSLGLAASEAVQPHEIEGLVRLALGDGWLGGDLDPERGGDCVCLAVIGSGTPRTERAAPNLRGALTEAARMVLPSARVSVATTTGPGVGLRLVVLLGGLTLPASAEEGMR